MSIFPNRQVLKEYYRASFFPADTVTMKEASEPRLLRHLAGKAIEHHSAFLRCVSPELKSLASIVDKTEPGILGNEHEYMWQSATCKVVVVFERERAIRGGYGNAPEVIGKLRLKNIRIERLGLRGTLASSLDISQDKTTSTRYGPTLLALPSE